MLKILVAGALMAGGAAQAQSGPAAETTVPVKFQGVWGKMGRCDRPADRLTIRAHRAGWGKGPFRPVTYDTADDYVSWASEYDVDNFQMGGTPDILVYNAQGLHMPAGRIGYAKCGADLRRVPWRPER